VGNLNLDWLAAGILVIAIVVVAVLAYARYRRDMRAAQERLQSGGSKVIETDCGPIEYATFGEGSPVLVVHGIFGGFDQGLLIARGNVGNEFHSIVPSRFGYLRTPHDAGARGESQVGNRDLPGWDP
jgi:2-hydroxy-6-oxonona-2,4-dienedioate hydrolase